MSALSRETVPFSPRLLSRNEKRDGDYFAFRSPKLGRIVELIDCVAMALALRFEFDPDVATYCERPRLLTYGDHQSIELAFWNGTGTGVESFWFLVPEGETRHEGVSRHEFRRSRALMEAAAAAHITIEYVFEDQLRALAPRLAVWYRLLPWVQSAHRLPNRHALIDAVMNVVETITQISIQQMEQSLAGYTVTDVRSVIADLIHQGRVELGDAERFGPYSIVRRRASHGGR